jgi:hypothetical protein
MHSMKLEGFSNSGRQCSSEELLLMVSRPCEVCGRIFNLIEEGM